MSLVGPRPERPEFVDRAGAGDPRLPRPAGGQAGRDRPGPDPAPARRGPEQRPPSSPWISATSSTAGPRSTSASSLERCYISRIALLRRPPRAARCRPASPRRRRSCAACPKLADPPAPAESLPPPMDFALFIVLNAVLLIRPEDFFPELAGLRLYLVTISLNVLVALPKILRQLHPEELARRPITACVSRCCQRRPFPWSGAAESGTGWSSQANSPRS